MLGRPRLAPIVAALFFASTGFWISWRWFQRPGLAVATALPLDPAVADRPELVEIEPGTLVGDEAPAGWSDLVIKSTMRLESGDIAALPGFAREMATLFRTVVLADLGRELGADGTTTHVLRRVGIGLALADRGGDLVVSPESLARLNVKLSLTESLVLDRAEAALRRGRLAARSSRFALYDAEVYLAEGGRHQPILLRYALLVVPGTGALRTLVWPVAADPADRVPPASVIALRPSLLFDCGLHVQAQWAFGQVPIGWNFAMAELPPGRLIVVPPRLQALLIGDPTTPEEVDRLERGLRRVLEDADQGEWSDSPKGSGGGGEEGDRLQAFEVPYPARSVAIHEAPLE